MKKILILIFCCTPFLVIAQIKHKTKATGGAAASAATLAAGKDIYTKYCLTCHQIDGGGVPNMNPPLVKTSYVSGDKKKLIKVVLNGFMQNVDIDGESYSNTMPPHNFLKDAEIAAVLTYIRNSFGNKYSAVAATQVKAVRATNKAN